VKGQFVVNGAYPNAVKNGLIEKAGRARRVLQAIKKTK
jgi:hypothetical protein